jgi:ABC-type phosphate transport system, periplasmic component
MKKAPTKKRVEKSLFIVAIGAIVILLGCATAYMYFTKSGLFAKSSEDDVAISSDPIFTIGDYPKIDASTATQPLAIAFMKNFTGETSVDVSKLNFTKTHQAYEKLIGGEVDLILVTQPSEDELALAKKKKVELEVIEVVKEGFVFFVSADNPVESLTTDEIQQIYTGNIKNWKEVGGPDLTIKAFQRPRNSGSQTGMVSLVMKDKKIMSAPKENYIEGMAGIVNLVSSYNNSRDAIGYSYYYYATTMYEDIDSNVANGIKFVSVDGVQPNTDTIKSGKYPFKTSYYIVINKAASEESPTRKLVEAMLSPRGQNVALEAKYVPAR